MRLGEAVYRKATDYSRAVLASGLALAVGGNKRTCVQANCRRGSHIQGLFTARLPDAHRQVGARHQCRADPLPFMPQHPGTGLGKNLFLQQPAFVRARDDQRHRQRGLGVDIQALQQMQAEMRTHASPQHLGRPKSSRSF